MAHLCLVEVYNSCVLSSDIDTIWQAVRRWGAAPWMKGFKEYPMRTLQLENTSCTEVGSTRMLLLGSAQIFERLTGLDEEEHILRWKLVSHPQTISPFDGASFINYTTSLQFTPVTVSNCSFALWKGQFFTEAYNVLKLKAAVEKWHLSGLQNMEDYTANRAVSGKQDISWLSQRLPNSLAGSASETLTYEPCNSFSSHSQRRGGVQPPRSSWDSTATMSFIQQILAGNFSQTGSVATGSRDSQFAGKKPMQNPEERWEDWYKLKPEQQRGVGSQTLSISPAQHTRRTELQQHITPEGPGPPQVAPSQSGQHTRSSGRSVDGGGSDAVAGRVRSHSFSNAANPSKVATGTHESEIIIARKGTPNEEDPDSTLSQAFGSSSQSAFDESRSTSWNSGLTSKSQHQASPQQQKQREAQKLQEEMVRLSLAPDTSQSEEDTVLMDSLNAKVEANQVANQPRSSFEEEAARLEARHKELHRNQKQPQGNDPAFGSPFMSPFTSPFDKISGSPGHQPGCDFSNSDIPYSGFATAAASSRLAKDYFHAHP